MTNEQIIQVLQGLVSSLDSPRIRGLDQVASAVLVMWDRQYGEEVPFPTAPIPIHPVCNDCKTALVPNHLDEVGFCESCRCRRAMAGRWKLVTEEMVGTAPFGSGIGRIGKLDVGKAAYQNDSGYWNLIHEKGGA